MTIAVFTGIGDGTVRNHETNVATCFEMSKVPFVASELWLWVFEEIKQLIFARRHCGLLPFAYRLFA